MWFKLEKRAHFLQYVRFGLNRDKDGDMPHKEIKKSIGELKEELTKVSQETGRFESVLAAAKEGVEKYTPEAVQDLVETLRREGTEFEIEHPQITTMINQIMTSLSNLGI